MTSTGHVRQTPAPTAAEWDDAPILKPESAFFDIQAQTISNGIDEELKWVVTASYSVMFSEYSSSLERVATTTGCQSERSEGYGSSA